ncbi:MAG: hypothetical protein GQ540_03900 [Lutibacter sp.]|uniref:hypothetical protein n=1 Tax=Lutibacter sp. TaxID=1925666 RepID=UPI0019F3CB31|nr:hypothetical protein [Lutibacter sp.]NOR27657.1 hypothetical protein [Lutibacter sp.]
MKKFFNIKTDHVYYKLDEVVNATNDRDGQIMVMYSPQFGNDVSSGVIYVRERKEFYEKFKEIK